MTIAQPLQVVAVGATRSAGALRQHADRATVVEVDTDVSPGRLLQRLREPDVEVVMVDAATADRVRPVATLAGLPVVMPEPGEDPASLIRRMGEAANRPGAGRDDGPPVTVLTTVWNEIDAIDGLLDRLAVQAREDDEILVVDGGSKDGTVEAIRRRAETDGRVTLIEAPGTNIPEGRNVGIRAAAHPVIACTDAGCTPVPGWLDALRAPFGEPDAPDLVTGVYRVTSRDPFEAAMAVAAYPLVEEARRLGPLTRLWSRAFGRNWDAAMPTGRSIAFTRDAWEAVGGFPEHLETGEDVTYGRAIVRTGRRAVLAVDAEVAWDQRATPRETARMYYRYGVGGGLSGDPKVVGRDLARVVALGATPVALALGGRRLRTLTGLGWAVLASVPLHRAVRTGDARTVALVPAALVLKDGAKAGGVLVGLWRKVRGQG